MFFSKDAASVFMYVGINYYKTTQDEWDLSWEVYSNSIFLMMQQEMLTSYIVLDTGRAVLH